MSKKPVKIVRYTTETGSLYEIDLANKNVRLVTKSSKSATNRVQYRWRPYEGLACEGIGHPLVISWGLGRDVHSPKATQVGTEGVGDESISRWTHTSPVVSKEIAYAGE